MNINDASTTSAISHVPAFRMNLTEFQGLLGVMRSMRNISLLCSEFVFNSFQNCSCPVRSSRKLTSVTVKNNSLIFQVAR